MTGGTPIWILIWPAALQMLQTCAVAAWANQHGPSMTGNLQVITKLKCLYVL